MADLTRRTVVCDLHGLRYDPNLSSGCIRCRREGLIPRTRPKFLPLLIALLAFTLVAARLVTAILEDRATPAEETVTRAGAADPRIDPGPYREEITRIEAALYPATAVDLFLLANRAASGGENLAAGLASAGRDGVARDVRAFATDLGGADLDSRGLRDARDRWYQLRNRHFLPAPWMVDQSARGDADPALVSAYLSFGSDLKTMVDEATDGGIDEGWTTRLDRLESRLPPEPAFRADSALVLGYRALSEALGAARRASASPDTASAALEEARRALEASNSQLLELGG